MSSIDKHDKKALERSFKLKDFEGPLDLLLFLIKKNEINVYDIPVAQITEQYLLYIGNAAALDLDDVTEFHAMAANLLYIKSRMLLPMELHLEEEREDPRQELVEKLIQYQKFKKLSELMEEKEREGEWVIERKRLQRDLPFTSEELWSKADVWELFKTFSSLMSNISSERVIDLYEEVSINEKVALLIELLEAQGACCFSDLVIRKGSMMDIICAFLGILEAVKMRMILIAQDRMFGDITIQPHEHFRENLAAHGGAIGDEFGDSVTTRDPE
ncbi:MAG: segregation/condensation protein A [Treponema sp.]|jgi:segregation and condensation protein A|nr:segregation/condensation protein A [Treponema sp.]